MKQFTEEERAAYRQQKKDKLQTIREALASLSEEEKARIQANCSIVTVEGHTLSPVNTVLTYLQYPDASVVAGFRQWKKARRSVKKGEHGFSIWAPKIQKTDGEETGEIDGFLAVTLFDISQTQPIGAE